MKIKAIYDDLINSFKESSISSPEINAERILCYVLNLDRLALHLQCGNEISTLQLADINKLKMRRLSHEPLQYILEETEFFGQKIRIEPGVLIPRPETEYLVEQIIKENQNIESILEIGCGSGCISIALAKNLSNVYIQAVDISSKVIEISQKNAALNDVSIDVIKSDLFENVTGKFDVIVSNPPYISSEDYQKLDREIREYEPREALEADENGLYFYRRILEQAKDFLTDNGRIYFEIGKEQGNAIGEIALNKGFSEFNVKKDLNNFDRYLIIK